MIKAANYSTLAYIYDQSDAGSSSPTSGVEIVSKEKLDPFKPGSPSNVAHPGRLESRGHWAGTDIFELVHSSQGEDTWITVLKEPVTFHEDFFEGHVRQILTTSGWIGDERESGAQRGNFIFLEVKENALMKEGKNIVHFLGQELHYSTPGFVFCALQDSLKK